MHSTKTQTHCLSHCTISSGKTPFFFSFLDFMHNSIICGVSFNPKTTKLLFKETYSMLFLERFLNEQKCEKFRVFRSIEVHTVFRPKKKNLMDFELGCVHCKIQHKMSPDKVNKNEIPFYVFALHRRDPQAKLLSARLESLFEAKMHLFLPTPFNIAFGKAQKAQFDTIFCL